jgi:hypothetical protein
LDHLAQKDRTFSISCSSISQVSFIFLFLPTPVYADLGKADPAQSNTKLPVASWGGNRIVSNDFFQAQ